MDTRTQTFLQADPFQVPQALEHPMHWPHSLPTYHWAFPESCSGAHSTRTLPFTLPQPYEGPDAAPTLGTMALGTERSDMRLNRTELPTSAIFDLEKCSFMRLSLAVCPGHVAVWQDRDENSGLIPKLPCRGFQEARGRGEGPLHGHAHRGPLTLRPAQLPPLSRALPCSVSGSGGQGLGTLWGLVRTGLPGA